MSHESGTLPAEGVRSMFDRIAPVYDVMNRVMTVGLDQRWRRLTVRQVVAPGNRVLDGCCGTGAVSVWGFCGRFSSGSKTEYSTTAQTTNARNTLTIRMTSTGRPRDPCRARVAVSLFGASRLSG